MNCVKTLKVEYYNIKSEFTKGLFRKEIKEAFLKLLMVIDCQKRYNSTNKL